MQAQTAEAMHQAAEQELSFVRSLIFHRLTEGDVVVPGLQPRNIVALRQRRYQVQRCWGGYLISWDVPRSPLELLVKNCFWFLRR